MKNDWMVGDIQASMATTPRPRSVEKIAVQPFNQTSSWSPVIALRYNVASHRTAITTPVITKAFVTSSDGSFSSCNQSIASQGAARITASATTQAITRNTNSIEQTKSRM